MPNMTIKTSGYQQLILILYLNKNTEFNVAIFRKVNRYTLHIILLANM